MAQSFAFQKLCSLFEGKNRRVRNSRTLCYALRNPREEKILREDFERIRELLMART